MAYIKFYLEDNKDFLLKPEGKKFLIHIASTSDDCKTLEEIIEFEHTPSCVIDVILKRFTESEKDKWFGNVDGYYILESIAYNNRINTRMLESIYDHIMEVYNYYLSNKSSYPGVLVSIISFIAQNPNASEELLKKILSSNCSVLEKVASNKGISNELLIQILNNTSNDRVKEAALEQIWERCPVLRPQSGQNS